MAQATENEFERVGLIGTGLMGAPMARRLLEAGFDLSVYNRTPDKALAAVGGDADRVCTTPSRLAAQVDIVILMLADTPTVEQVVTGPDGVLESLAIPLSLKSDALPLLAYLKSLLEHGPGVRARDGVAGMLALKERTDMRRYVAGGRRIALKMLGGKKMPPGAFASLLEEESRWP